MSDAAPRALIADDEPHLASYLRERLAVVWPELDIVGVACDGPEALRLIAEQDPDVLFLDIRMPGLTGLDVARRAATDAQRRTTCGSRRGTRNAGPDAAGTLRIGASHRGAPGLGACGDRQPGAPDRG